MKRYLRVPSEQSVSAVLGDLGLIGWGYVFAKSGYEGWGEMWPYGLAALFLVVLSTSIRPRGAE